MIKLPNNAYVVPSEILSITPFQLDGKDLVRVVDKSNMFYVFDGGKEIADEIAADIKKAFDANMKRENEDLRQQLLSLTKKPRSESYEDEDDWADSRWKEDEDDWEDEEEGSSYDPYWGFM